MSAVQAIASKIKAYGMRVIQAKDFDCISMIDVTSDVTQSDTDIHTINTHDIFEDGSAVSTYRFNNDATDLGGTYDGIATNITYSVGKYNESAVFNGVDSNISLINPSPSYSGLSYSFWVKPSNATHYGHYVSNSIGLNGDDPGFRIYQYNEQLRITGISSTNVGWWDVTTPINLNTLNGFTTIFNHIVFVLQDDRKTFQLHIDGELIESGVLSEVFDDIISAPLDLGYLHNSGYLEGHIDQFRIFNRALTADEATTLYNETENMVVMPYYS